MSRFLDFLDHGLTEQVGEDAAFALIFGVPAIVIGIVALAVTGDLVQAVMAGLVGSAFLLYVVSAVVEAQGQNRQRAAAGGTKEGGVAQPNGLQGESKPDVMGTAASDGLPAGDADDHSPPSHAAP